MISFEDVSFTYTNESYVLEDLSVEIPQGQFVCVLGANGSGKSTFSKLINALLLPDKGKVKVDGLITSDAQNTFSIRSKAGSVFQNPDDQIVASLVENDVAFGPENLGIPNPELRERVEAALAQVGLTGFEKHETNALSGGQKQRVAIAGILAMEPQILIFDEASAMLDPRGRRGLMRVCKELHASPWCPSPTTWKRPPKPIACSCCAKARSCSMAHPKRCSHKIPSCASSTSTSPLQRNSPVFCKTKASIFPPSSIANL